MEGSEEGVDLLMNKNSLDLLNNCMPSSRSILNSIWKGLLSPFKDEKTEWGKEIISPTAHSQTPKSLLLRRRTSGDSFFSPHAPNG